MDFSGEFNKSAFHFDEINDFTDDFFLIIYKFD